MAALCDAAPAGPGPPALLRRVQTAVEVWRAPTSLRAVRVQPVQAAQGSGLRCLRSAKLSQNNLKAGAGPTESVQKPALARQSQYKPEAGTVTRQGESAQA